ncbi:MAG: hypothetical protein EBU85_06880, partial [Actinobacteria bacterium]|nr:hypothetical protein [Actinomycetota bacterium]
MTKGLVEGDRIGAYTVADSKPIGSGGFGQVYRCVDARGGVFAVKLLKPSVFNADVGLESFERELRAAKRVSSSYLAGLDTWEIKHEPRYLAYDFFSGRPLSELQTPLSKTRLQTIFRQIAWALVDIHGAGVVHRDINPRNVLIGKQDRVKVIDLGLASFGRGKGLSRMGVSNEMRTLPEIRQDPIPANDIWAFGDLLLRCMYGTAAWAEPLEGESGEALVAAVARAGIDSPALRDLRALATECLNPIPQDRPTAQELLSRLHTRSTAKSSGATPVKVRDWRAEWEALAALVQEARTRYYQHDAPTISDEEYDTAFRRLLELETQFPELQSADSPTQSVGGNSSEMFEPVRHLLRMFSLDNAFSETELSEWTARVERDLANQPDYLCELKVDGLAVDIVYERGRLKTLATRGDGRVGENVTFNVQFIPGIPAALDSAKAQVPELLEVRGEVYFAVADFEELNREQNDRGLPAFANPRNAAAGTLRQRTDRRIEAVQDARTKGRESTIARAASEFEQATSRLRRLRLVVHGIGATVGYEPAKQSAAYDALAKWGLPVSPHTRVVAGGAAVA